MADGFAELERVAGPELLRLDNQLCFALHAAARDVVRAYRPLLGKLGLTYSQYLVLLVLWEWERTHEARPTLNALGARLSLDSGTLTPLLNRLEQRGLVRSRRPRDDQRERVLRLTAPGRRLEARARRVPIELLRCSSLPLGDLLRLRDELKRLRAALQGHTASQDTEE